MHDVHLRGLDLNLLRVLDALLAERSATGAGRKLGLSQSAVSHALNRLRDALGDPLLVRVGNQLVPSPRAEALRGPLREALERLEAALSPHLFDPAGATGSFVVGSADYVLFLFGAALYRQVEQEAPGVDLRLVSIPGSANAALTAGSVDLALAVWRPDERLPEGVARRKLLADEFVCLLRPGNPMAEPWTLDTFTQLRHVQVAPGGTAGGPLDSVLERLGRTRRIALTLPSFLVAPRLVAGSDAVLTLPSRLARPLAEELGLELRTLPFEAPGFDLSMGWHARTEADPAQRWLRGVVAAVAAAGGRPGGEAARWKDA